MLNISLIKRGIISITIALLSFFMVMSSSSEYMPGAADSAGSIKINEAEKESKERPISKEALLSSYTNTERDKSYRLFPAAFSTELSKQEKPGKPFGPGISSGSSNEPENMEDLGRIPILAGNQILAFYGKPGSPSMGILGEYSKEALAPILEAYARLYDEVNGPMGVIPALYLIYGTCWPEGEIGILNKKVVESYIEFAAEKGWIVFLDHQIGKYDVLDSVKSMLPFLQYPNVHLAIDPEWRTTKPMQEIGYVNGPELNSAQKLIDDYLKEKNLPGIRMLIVHQFKPSMIREASVVRADYDRVLLVHTADGFGVPEVKRYAYAMNAKSKNMPIKGFKLFFESKVPGAGWDKPLMLPKEVILLNPMPLIIIYQ